jgi:hypothetical protein
VSIMKTSGMFLARYTSNFSGIKRLGIESDRLPSTSAEVMNKRSCRPTSPPAHPVLLRCTVKNTV